MTLHGGVGIPPEYQDAGVKDMGKEVYIGLLCACYLT